MRAEYSSKPQIRVSGSPLGEQWLRQLERVVVDDHLLLPAMFELAFRDPRRELLKQTGIAVGTKLSISAVSETGSESLLSGEVTALEGDFDATGAHVVVRGYELSHRLHRGRKTRAWLEKSDAAIVRQIAGEASIPVGAIDDGGSDHPYLVQANVTDWEFLRARARESGSELTVADGKLAFGSPTDASDAPDTGSFESSDARQLVLGDNLVAFRPRLTAAEQVTKVEVRGWDPTTKKAVVGTANAKTVSAAVSLTPAVLAGKFSGGTHIATDRPLQTVADAKAEAKTIAERIASAAVEAEGVAEGEPALRAGTAVSVAGAGKPFDGRYVLSSTRHVFDHDGYRTHFVVSGRQERSLLGLTSAGATNGELHPASALHGVSIGVVTDIKDPEDQGRVKVKFPSISSSYSTDWARVAYLGAGKDRGFVSIPEVDDEVLVCFAHGDPRQPYVIGSLFNGKDKPKDGSELVDGLTGKVKRWRLNSRLGNVLEFRDNELDQGVILSAAGSPKNESIELEGTNHKIKISSGGAIEIESTGSVSLKATTSMTISAGASLTLSAPQVKISGDAMVEIASSGPLQMKGTVATLQAEATMTVSANAVCTIQGALVRIN